MKKRAMLVSIMLATQIFDGYAVAQPVDVVAGQYVIQRKNAGNITSLSADQVRYVTIKGSEHFDLVSPYSAGATIQSSKAQIEPVDWPHVYADCAQILKDPTVLTCEPNIIVKAYAVPNDAMFTSQWGLHDPVKNADIEALAAWDKGTGTSETIIGIIDTGIKYNHPDLIDNLWTNPADPYPLDGIDNDGNGYVDDVLGIDAIAKNNAPYDCDGHGTHVAGIIGARGNNQQGVTGVNWRASMIAARVFDCSGSTTTDILLAAYDYFYELKKRGNNIRVVNASLGGPSFSAAQYSAIERLASVDILFVAAAGNEDTNNDTTPFYPADHDLPNIISVGATGPTLESASYSNYGQSVDLAAPGGDMNRFGEAGGIYSTWIEPELFKSMQGTSMAAPMVTGAIGLIASQRPHLSGAQLKEMLLASADRVPTLASYTSGGRFLNVGAMSQMPDSSDNCPNDPDKIEPGVCGCGISDDDANNNGVADCTEGSDLESVVPDAPSIKPGKKTLSFNLTPREGVEYVLKVKITRPGYKTTTKFLWIPFTSGRLIKLPSGSSVTLSYYYIIDGAEPIFSLESPRKRAKIK